MSAQPKPKYKIEIMPLASDDNGLLTPESQRIAAAPDGAQFPIDAAVWIAVDHSRDGVDKIVGRIAAFPVMHLESTFVAEDLKGTSLAVRLVKTAEAALRDAHYSHAFAYSPNDEVSDYLKRFGYVEVPVRVFSKELK